MIKSNFDTHLELTLLSNPDLICKYPQYKEVMTKFMQKHGLSVNQLHVPELIPVDLTLRYESNLPRGSQALHDAIQPLLVPSLGDD